LSCFFLIIIIIIIADFPEFLHLCSLCPSGRDATPSGTVGEKGGGGAYFFVAA